MVIPSDEQPVEGLSALVGRNAKRLREQAGLSLDDVARAAAPFTRWTTSRVANIESGRSLPSLSQLLVYCIALDIAGAEGIRLADLFDGDTAVKLTDTGPPVYVSALHRVFSGAPIAFGPGDLHGVPTSSEELSQRVAEILREAVAKNFPNDDHLPPGVTESQKVATLVFQRGETGLADERAAKKLGLSTDELTVWSNRLWRKTFSAERDARAGDAANAQVKGQVTRALLAEIRNALTEAVDQPPTR
ncbi:helix-turn-helix domain-containing protein [Nocardia thailandica]